MRFGPAAAAVATVVMILSLSNPAGAASTNLYLKDDGIPRGSMSTDRPSGGPGRSRTLQPSSKEAGETDPERFQEWSYPMSNMTASVNEFTIWITPADPSEEGKIAVSVHILDCASSCVTLSSSTRSMAGVASPTKVTLPVTLNGHEFTEGHELRAKVTVPTESARDVTILYASKNRDSNLHLSALTVTPPSTTTTTLATTTTTATTTTVPPTTTTVSPSTTVQQTSTTTSPSRDDVTLPPSTTTTTVASTSTTEAVTVVSPTTTTAPPPPRTASDLVDRGAFPPEVVHLGDPTEESEAVLPPSHPLEPQEGMLIMFSTAVEAFRLYWQVALALGTVMAVLLIVGFSRLELPGPERNPFERIRRFG